MRSSLVLCSLLLGVILVSSVQVFGKEDPELKVCQHQCKSQQQADEPQIRACMKECEKYSREKQRREEEYGGRGRYEGGGRQDRERQQGRSRGQREEEIDEGNNPYVFHDKHFSSIFQTEHGRISELQRFSERSELLEGIDNYRLVILEAEPQTFIIPNHFDAEAVFFVVKGKGAISQIRADTEKNLKRESFNIKKGDVLRIPSGTPLYLINRDSNEKLIIAKILQPVSTPGYFEPFFGAGGENPESFYTTFSTEILEAAFNTKREDLEKVFGGERKEEGVIIKASSEQIKAMSHHEKGGIWPFGGDESKGAINIFEQSPKSSNQYGKFYQVSANELRELEDIDIQVSYLNLTKNAMVGPAYTSKATRISLVVEGEGYFEMACPHLSSQSSGHQSQRRSQSSYQKVNTRLSKGMVVVVPAGHPAVVMASNNQNLEVVSFDIHARNSWDYVLAGKGNVASQFEKEAKELAFGVASELVDEVFGSQEEQVFYPGPRQQQREQREEHGGRAYE